MAEKSPRWLQDGVSRLADLLTAESLERPPRVKYGAKTGEAPLLIVDLESTGLVRDGLQADAPEHPSICQIGAHLLDASYQPLAILEALIKPEGVSVEPEAQAVHGIPETDCIRYGIDVRVALALFQQLCLRARVIVAFNMEFDRRVIAAQLAKIGSDGLWWQRQAPKFRCAMELATPHCKIPGEFGLKFPTLEEAYRHFHPGVEFHTTHRAGADIAACAEIYRKIQEQIKERGQ